MVNRWLEVGIRERKCQAQYKYMIISYALEGK